jgi:hypothetical protein
MDYGLLTDLVKPDRVLDIWASEAGERQRRRVLLSVAQTNDRIETLLENMEYIDSKGVITLPENSSN